MLNQKWMNDVTFENKIYINVYSAFLYLNEFEPLPRMIPLQLAGDFVCERKSVDFEQKKNRKRSFEFFFFMYRKILNCKWISISTFFFLPDFSLFRWVNSFCSISLIHVFNSFTWIVNSWQNIFCKLFYVFVKIYGLSSEFR